uniref:Uncharacterized protein n=1 Tax=Opuntia streptacantha TaxID=393608 RepID=A0A7C9ENY8_OPUST
MHLRRKRAEISYMNSRATLQQVEQRSFACPSPFWSKHPSQRSSSSAAANSSAVGCYCNQKSHSLSSILAHPIQQGNADIEGVVSLECIHRDVPNAPNKQKWPACNGIQQLKDTDIADI